MSLLSSYHRSRLLVGTASVVCFCLFWWAGSLFGIPVHRGFEASLLQQPFALGILLMVAVVLGGAAVIGTAIAGTVRPEAGLFAAALGLSALSFRGGSSRYVIFWALAQENSSHLFLKLLVETLILSLFIAGVWSLLQVLRTKGLIREYPGSPSSAKSLLSDRNELLALGVQTVATATGILLLATVETKQQVLAAVFIASLLGPLVTSWILPAPPRIGFWLAPLLVGIVGYALAYYDSTGIATASLRGSYAALARPLPLDYASAGPAGAILGYWITQQASIEQDASPAPAVA